MLDAPIIGQPAPPLAQGQIDPARERLEGAENELRRLARDIEDLPLDAKALATRLFRRQDSLNHDVDQVLADFRDRKEPGRDGRAALAEKLKPLRMRQQAIARLARRSSPRPDKTAAPASHTRLPATRLSESAKAAETLAAREPN